MTTASVVALLAIGQAAAAHAEGLQVIGDDRVVDQFAEHGDRFVTSEIVSVAQGVADAEAHAVMGSEGDFHDSFLVLGFQYTLWHKVFFHKKRLSA